MVGADGEWHGDMITVQHTAPCERAESLQDDVISSGPLWIPTALWGSDLHREGRDAEKIPETLSQMSPIKTSATCGQLCKSAIPISDVCERRGCRSHSGPSLLTAMLMSPSRCTQLL